MTLGDILTEQVRVRPQAVALVDLRGEGERRLTFAELEHDVAATAAWMQAQGLRRGTAVLVFVPMSADLYVALLAMFRVGVVALFLDPSAGAAHLEQCCARWRPDALLAVPRAHLLRFKSAALRRIPLKYVLGGWMPGARRWRGGDPGVRLPLATPVSADDPALVTFTSGSTGTPKAAVRTHAFLAEQYRVLAPHLALAPGQVDLATLPVFTLANLAAGVTTVIPGFDLRRPGAVDGAAIVAAIARGGVTRVTASPAFFERLIEAVQARGETLPALRHLHTGGAPVFPRLLQALRDVAPAARVVSVYGSTEAEPIAHVNAADFSESDQAAMRSGEGLLAGRPVSEIRLRVIEDRWGAPRGPLTPEEFEHEEQPVGAVGEIVVSGGHVLRGYLRGVGDSDTKFTVGGDVWHRTGDAGRLDAHGRLWLMGRCAARIDDVHGRLYPFAVECVAMTYPEVRRAAVVAHRRERWLIVEVAGQRERLESQLLGATAWAHVVHVRTVKRLPVDARHNAKIDYPALHRLLGD